MTDEMNDWTNRSLTPSVTVQSPTNQSLNHLSNTKCRFKKHSICRSMGDHPREKLKGCKPLIDSCTKSPIKPRIKPPLHSHPWISLSPFAEYPSVLLFPKFTLEAFTDRKHRMQKLGDEWMPRQIPQTTVVLAREWNVRAFCHERRSICIRNNAGWFMHGQAKATGSNDCFVARA